MEPVLLTPVGMITSSLTSLDACPLQGAEGAPEATITVYEPFKQALEGIAEGQSIMILTWLHLAKRDVLQCYPRKETSAAHIGVFATRSPDRPNPIGYHEVEVIGVHRDGTLKVHPLEVLDGTPVLDIKPLF